MCLEKVRLSVNPLVFISLCYSGTENHWFGVLSMYESPKAVGTTIDSWSGDKEHALLFLNVFSYKSNLIFCS